MTITIDNQKATELVKYMAKEKANLDHALSKEFLNSYEKKYCERIPEHILDGIRNDRDLLDYAIGQIQRNLTTEEVA